MATVFRARDERHGRTVAVKVLHPELSEALGAERFLREVQITARLTHPHILPLLDSGEADGLLYYVMPFVEGESLRERLVREGQLSVPEALKITREVADALGHAHAHDVMHRDVKPENILLLGSHAVVADFGIARALGGSVESRLTETGLSIGTPVYMSPEQSQGERVVDGRTDIYSLGCVLYEMLVGEPPFSGPNAMAVTARKLTEPVPPLRTRRTTVTAPLEVVILKALERSPADRYRTAAEFSDALGAAVGDSGGHAVGQASGDAIAAAAVGAHSGGAASTKVRWNRLIAAAAALGVIALVAWYAVAGPERAAANTDLRSVAVLPFASLSADSAQAYVAEGLTDELVTSLSMVEGLRVASRTSTLLLAGQGLDLAALAARLSVESVLEGSVRADGNRVRVSARLVNASEGYPIWSETYERAADDILRIQEEIAAAIAEALRGRLGAGQASVVSSGTTSPEAYDLYLQARALRGRQTEQSLSRSVDFYREAIAIDARFARAYEGLGSALAVMGWYEYSEPRDVFPLAAEAAAEALRLDTRLAAAHSTAAYVALYYDWDLERAERGFLRALEVDPNSAISHQWYGNYLSIVQRFDESERAFRRSVTLDPAAAVRRATEIWVRYYRGNYAEAVETYRRVVDVDSSYGVTFQWGAMALEELGQTAEALRAAQWASTISNEGTSFLASLARAHAAHGNDAEARVLLERIKAARVVPAYDVAKVYLALGDHDEAFRWLDRAYEMRSRWMVFLKIDPQLRPVHDDPRYGALVQRVGL